MIRTSLVSSVMISPVLLWFILRRLPSWIDEPHYPMFLTAFTGTVLICAAMTVMNGLSYRIMHANRLQRRLNATQQVDGTKFLHDRDASREQQELAQPKAEFEDLVWKICDPVSFVPLFKERAATPLLYSSL